MYCFTHLHEIQNDPLLKISETSENTEPQIQRPWAQRKLRKLQSERDIFQRDLKITETLSSI